MISIFLGICIGTVGISYTLFTLAFVFWFAYLLQDVIKRRSCCRSALKEINESSDGDQQEIGYSANTEYVKSKFLFSINIIEWIAATFAAATTTLYLSSFFFCNQQFPSNDSEIDSTILSNLTVKNASTQDCIMVSSHIDTMLSRTSFMLLPSSYNLLLLGLVIVSCLCNYLTARYARKSWIKHDKIPYIITLTVVFITITQISSLFCYLTLIVRWVHFLVLVLVLVFGMHQSRKLRMVINWTVVDLEISRTNLKQLSKFKRMNKRLSIFFAILWIGSISIFLFIFLINMRYTIELTFQLIKQTDFSLCSLHNVKIPNYIFIPLIVFEIIFCVVGFVLFCLPYVICGFSTMSVMMWFCIRGKTGYRTHFHISLKTPLLKTNVVC